MKRFIISPSKEKENHFVVIDRESKIVVVFERNFFNETQEVTDLEEIKSIDFMKKAKALRELGEWMNTYHKDKI